MSTIEKLLQNLQETHEKAILEANARWERKYSRLEARIDKIREEERQRAEKRMAKKLMAATKALAEISPA